MVRGWKKTLGQYKKQYKSVAVIPHKAIKTKLCIGVTFDNTSNFGPCKCASILFIEHVKMHFFIRV